MRYLLISLLFLTSCSYGKPDWTTVELTDLKFKAGELVYTNLVFYSECKGFINGYSSLKTEGKVSYVVKFYCPNIGRVSDVVISESLLMVKK